MNANFDRLWVLKIIFSSFLVLLIDSRNVAVINSFLIDDVKSSSSSSSSGVGAGGEQQLISPIVSNGASIGSSSALFEDYTSSSLSSSSSSSSTFNEDKSGVWRKLNECKSDLNCVNLNSICLDGNCVRICTMENGTSSLSKGRPMKFGPIDFKEKCVYFHCDSKRIIRGGDYYTRPSSSSSSSVNEFSIETNNYPLLNRYLSKKKCAWILNNGGVVRSPSSLQLLPFGQVKASNSFIQLKFERFSTQLANDYLYIFAGDSINSPLIAALSGNQLASDEPSLSADRENLETTENVVENRQLEEDDEEDPDALFGVKLASLNITFFNFKTLFLLFKTDVTSSFSILNNFKSTRFNNKPSGISIKYMFSSSCSNEALCYNETFQAQTQATTANSNDCSKLINVNEKLKCEQQVGNVKIVQTIQYSDEDKISSNSQIETSNSHLRRAFHCSFEYKNYLYVIGGYSFSQSGVSFVSRMDLNTSVWEHSIDRKSSTIINRSNRRFFGQPDFKQPKLDLPQPRYAHSCALDADDDHFYMFGGVTYDVEKSLPQHSFKQTTNELWSYNLLTNKWSLINSASVSNETEQARYFNKSYVLPIAASGHSMQLVERGAYGKSILIFFGYSEFYASNLNLVQEYVLSSKTWLLHNTLYINIGYAHSSTLDKINSIVYFYGGLVIKNEYSSKSIFDYTDQFSESSFSNGKFAQSISSSLYSFDLLTFEWKKLTKSIQSCFMHSAALYQNEKIIFYGGICDNNHFSYLNSAFVSNQIRVYSIPNKEWKFSFSKSAEATKFSIKLSRRQRYSHSSFVYNNSIYIFAGFNGFFLSDLFRVDLTQIDFGVVEKQTKVKRSLDSITADEFKLKRPYLDFYLNKTYNTIRKLNSPQRGELFKLQARTLNANESDFNFLVTSCLKFTSCISCHLDPNCVWHKSKCEPYLVANFNSQSNNSNNLMINRPVYKKPQCTQLCSEHLSCENCTALSNVNGQFQTECVWCPSQAKCVLKKAIHIHFPFGDCIYLTTDRSKCHFEQESSRMYLTQSLKASNSTTETHCSSQHSNCSSCIRDERCGWCSADNEFSAINPQQYLHNTGLGKCIEGGVSGAQPDMNCAKNWFYDMCPPCECNGHSQCSNNLPSNVFSSSILATLVTNTAADPNSLTCAQPCWNNTDGDFCQYCAQGFFGHAENNGFCQPCDCGRQASECDSKKGTCFCNTKGVVGAKCDQCDTPRYTGQPNQTDGSCFYNLTTDYQFTFNLNKDSDRYYTRINFVNHIAHGMDDDIDFMVRCYRETAYINLTYVSNYAYYDDDDGEQSESLRGNFNEMDWPFDLIENLSYLWQNLNANGTSRTFGPKSMRIKQLSFEAAPPVSSRSGYYFGPLSNQNSLLMKINCTTSEQKYTFYNKDLNYADKSRNFLFIVYVYDFQSPITVQVAFSRRTRVQLLHFFITFFGCLLSLLTIAFITWKVKQRYDRYRRHRQIVMQQEHMASRPFTRLFIDVVNNDEKEKLMMESTQQFQQIKHLNRSESNKSSSGFGDSGKRFLNTLKSSFKIGAVANKSPRSNDPNESTHDTDLIEDKPRLISSMQIEQMSKKFKIMPVAVEPLSNNKSAILTCILRLPQGGLNSTPKGSSPFVLCSTYVQLTSNSTLVNFSNLESDEPSNELTNINLPTKKNEF